MTDQGSSVGAQGVVGSVAWEIGHETLPNEQEEQVRLGLELKQKELDLEKDYSGRLMKIITAQQMLNLRKAEGDFQRMILQQVQQRRMMQQRNENIRERNQQLQKRN